MRYAIKSPTGYYAMMTITETVPVILNGVGVVGYNETYRPKFEGFIPAHGSQFDTESDALALMANKEFGGPEAFADCYVVESP